MGACSSSLPHGDEYVGDKEWGKKKGFGTYTWANGDKYVGQWENDQRHGEGEMKFADGGFYRGIFHRGHMQGQGLLTMPHGTYEGEAYCCHSSPCCSYCFALVNRFGTASPFALAPSRCAVLSC